MTDHVTEQPQVLAEAEVSRRILLLAELHAALTALGARCVMARKQRLVLRYNPSPSAPSGPVDPQLHIFAGDGTDIATTDGASYSLASGGQYPAGDPAAAAAVVVARLGRAGER